MFLNLSNHPSANWNPSQYLAAEEYGKVIDMAFPAVDPMLDSKQLDQLVEEYYQKVLSTECTVVMLQGEMTFTFRLVTRLKAAGILCVAACSKRDVKERKKPDGTIEKSVVFDFCGFREY